MKATSTAKWVLHKYLSINYTQNTPLSNLSIVGPDPATEEHAGRLRVEASDQKPKRSCTAGL